MNFDGAGNSTLNAKATHTVNAGDNASINVGTAEKGQSAPSFLTMDSAGNITLKSSSSIRLSIDDKTCIELTSDKVTIKAATVSVVGTTSAAIGSDEGASKGLKADAIGVTINGGGLDVTINGENVNIN